MIKQVEIDEGVPFVVELSIPEMPDAGYLTALEQARDHIMASGELSPDAMRTVNLLDMRIAQVCAYMGCPIYDA